MVTFLWIAYDIFLFIAGYYLMERKLTQREVCVLTFLGIIGIGIAIYGGMSEHDDSMVMSSLQQGQEQIISSLKLNPKAGTQAALDKINELQTRVAQIQRRTTDRQLTDDQKVRFKAALNLPKGQTQQASLFESAECYECIAFAGDILTTWRQAPGWTVYGDATTYLDPRLTGVVIGIYTPGCEKDEVERITSAFKAIDIEVGYSTVNPNVMPGPNSCGVYVGHP